MLNLVIPRNSIGEAAVELIQCVVADVNYNVLDLLSTKWYEPIGYAYIHILHIRFRVKEDLVSFLL